eukprot:scaffold6963_cov69-Phaeocystis_antarctica.AAC.2
MTCEPAGHARAEPPPSCGMLVRSRGQFKYLWQGERKGGGGGVREKKRASLFTFVDASLHQLCRRNTAASWPHHSLSAPLFSRSTPCCRHVSHASERAAIAESSARRADRRRLELGGGVGAVGRAAVARRA